MAVHSAAVGKRKLLVAFLVLTLILGGIFLSVKGYEYHDKFVHHEVPGMYFDCEGCVDAGHTPLFFSLYFGMTGLHAMHMIVGVGDSDCAHYPGSKRVNTRRNGTLLFRRISAFIGTSSI